MIFGAILLSAKELSNACRRKFHADERHRADEVRFVPPDAVNPTRQVKYQTNPHPTPTPTATSTPTHTRIHTVTRRSNRSPQAARLRVSYPPHILFHNASTSFFAVIRRAPPLCPSVLFSPLPPPLSAAVGRLCDLRRAVCHGRDCRVGGRGFVQHHSVVRALH